MKGHILCDYTYMKHPERANPKRQEVDEWVPGAAGRAVGRMGNDENILELVSDDGCVRYKYTKCHRINCSLSNG